MDRLTDTQPREIPTAPAALADAQASVIGALLLAPERMGEAVLALSEDDFLDPAWRAIYAAACRIYRDGRQPDAVLVAAEAGDAYRPRIIQAMTAQASATALPEHIRVLQSRARHNRLQLAGFRLSQARTAEEAAAAVAEIAAADAPRALSRVTAMPKLLAGFAARQKQKPDYVRWGMSFLDACLYLDRGGMLLIGARPSAGKTALALQLSLAISQTRRVGFFSLETSPDILADRIVAGETGTSFGGIKRRNLDAAAVDHLADMLSRRKTLERQLEVIDAAGMSVSEIRALTLARRYDVVIVDYVQIVRSENRRSPRLEQVTEISQDLRALAGTCGVTVVGLAQLSRPERGEKSRAPTMRDLRECGQLEQDADAVLLLYLEDEGQRTGRRVLKLDKNKEGIAGRYIRLDFDGDTQRFTPVVGSDLPEDAPTMASIYAAGRAARRSTFRPVEVDQLEIPFQTGGGDRDGYDD